MTIDEEFDEEFDSLYKQVLKCIDDKQKIKSSFNIFKIFFKQFYNKEIQDIAKEVLKIEGKYEFNYKYDEMGINLKYNKMKNIFKKRGIKV